MLDWHKPFLPYISREDYAGAVEGLKNFLRVFGRAYLQAEDIPVSTTNLLENMLDMLEELLNEQRPVEDSGKMD